MSASANAGVVAQAEYGTVSPPDLHGPQHSAMDGDGVSAVVEAVAGSARRQSRGLITF